MYCTTLISLLQQAQHNNNIIVIVTMFEELYSNYMFDALVM